MKISRKVLFKAIVVIAVVLIGLVKFYSKNAWARKSIRNSFKTEHVDKWKDNPLRLRACDKIAREVVSMIKNDSKGELIKGYEVVGDEVVHLVSLTDRDDCFFLMGSQLNNEIRPWVISYNGGETPEYVYEYESLSDLHNVNEGGRGVIKFQKREK